MESERKAELVGLEGWEHHYGLVAKGVEEKDELLEDSLTLDLKDFERFISSKTYPKV